MEPYRVEFTALAKAIAQTRYTLDSVEARVRAEIDAMSAASGKSNINGLACMMVSMEDDLTSGEGEPEEDDGKTYFFCDSVEAGVLRIDLGEFEETEQFKDGPFKGKILMMPRAMSRESISVEELFGGEFP